VRIAFLSPALSEMVEAIEDYDDQWRLAPNTERDTVGAPSRLFLPCRRHWPPHRSAAEPQWAGIAP
jgi:hypothetical protein